MTSSTCKGSETLSSCVEAHDSFLVRPLFTQEARRRPQAKVSARSPSTQAGLLGAKHGKANLNQRRHRVTSGGNCYPTRQTTAVTVVCPKHGCLKSLALNPLLPAHNGERELEVKVRPACCRTYLLPRRPSHVHSNRCKSSLSSSEGFGAGQWWLLHPASNTGQT